MYYKVIRYWTCFDVVGCKFIVPQSKEHEALSANMWPVELTVRKWEAPDKWYNYQDNDRNNNDYGNNWASYKSDYYRNDYYKR